MQTEVMKYRKRLGLSQHQLAVKAKLGQSEVSEIERGERTLSVRNAEKLAGVFKAEPVKLYARQTGDVAQKAADSRTLDKATLYGTLRDLENQKAAATNEQAKADIGAVIAELEKVVGSIGDTPPEAATKSQQGSRRRGARDGRRMDGRSQKSKNLERDARHAGQRQERERNAFNGTSRPKRNKGE